MLDTDWPEDMPVSVCLDCSDHNNDETGVTEVFRELAKKQEPLGAEFEAAIGDQSTLYETDEPA